MEPLAQRRLGLRPLEETVAGMFRPYITAARVSLSLRSAKLAITAIICPRLPLKFDAFIAINYNYLSIFFFFSLTIVLLARARTEYVNFDKSESAEREIFMTGHAQISPFSHTHEHPGSLKRVRRLFRDAAMRI